MRFEFYCNNIENIAEFLEMSNAEKVKFMLNVEEHETGQKVLIEVHAPLNNR